MKTTHSRTGRSSDSLRQQYKDHSFKDLQRKRPWLPRSRSRTPGSCVSMPVRRSRRRRSTRKARGWLASESDGTSSSASSRTETQQVHKRRRSWPPRSTREDRGRHTRTLQRRRTSQRPLSAIPWEVISQRGPRPIERTSTGDPHPACSAVQETSSPTAYLRKALTYPPSTRHPRTGL